MTRQQQEIKMLGFTVETLESIEETPLFISHKMMAISALSDVQEMLLLNGDKEKMRQMINQAKFWINKV